MRVVHLSSVHRAGDTRVLVRECETIASRFPVTLIALRDRSLSESSIARCATDVRMIDVVARRGIRLRRIACVVRAGLRARADLYHLHDPELFVFAPVMRAFGAFVIADVHEDLPAAFAGKSRRSTTSRLLGALGRSLELVADRLANHVIVADPALAHRFRRVTIIENLALTGEFRTVPPDASARTGLVYVGDVSLTRGLIEMLELAAGLAAHPLGRVRIVGELSPPELMGRIASHPGRPLTTFTGLADRPTVVAEMHSAAIGLALLSDHPNYRFAQPTKVFEYMAAGLPTIASDLEGWRDLFDEECGVILVDPTDAVAVAAAARTLLDAPQRRDELGAAARRAFEDRWSWDAMGARLLDLYRSIETSTRRGHRP